MHILRRSWRPFPSLALSQALLRHLCVCENDSVYPAAGWLRCTLLVEIRQPVHKAALVESPEAWQGLCDAIPDRNPDGTA